MHQESACADNAGIPTHMTDADRLAFEAHIRNLLYLYRQLGKGK
jgi:hypothetical protein